MKKLIKGEADSVVHTEIWKIDMLFKLFSSLKKMHD